MARISARPRAESALGAASQCRPPATTRPDRRWACPAPGTCPPHLVVERASRPHRSSLSPGSPHPPARPARLAKRGPDAALRRAPGPSQQTDPSGSAGLQGSKLLAVCRSGAFIRGEGCQLPSRAPAVRPANQRGGAARRQAIRRDPPVHPQAHRRRNCPSMATNAAPGGAAAWMNRQASDSGSAPSLS